MNIYQALFVLTICFLTWVQPAYGARPICGDGVIKGEEVCDGANLDGMDCPDFGFAEGTLTCTETCVFDTSGCFNTSESSCGDGLADGSEECDGADDSSCPGRCSIHCACPAMAPQTDLEVHMIDVGQGDAFLVVSPDGFVMLIDAGNEGDVDTILNYMAAQGISSIDYSLVSHLHADHLGAMEDVLAQVPEVTSCFDHGGRATTAEFLEYEAAAGARRITVGPSDLIDLGPSVRAEVLHAYSDASLENNNSVVLRLTYNMVSFLFGGDCEDGCESTFDPGLTDVYKVHHHGAPGSSSEGFLGLMQPDVALIPVGAENPYGHPAQETLDRLAAVGATVYRSDLDGDVPVYCDGYDFSVGVPPLCSEGQTQTCGVTDIGACEYGTETCTEGSWGVCFGAIDPVTEDCSNGVDDDCDGDIDAADANCNVVADHLVFSQVGYDTPGTDDVEEFIDLYNPTGAMVELSGWTVSDNLGTWTFPIGLQIGPGAYFSVARDVAGFRALYGIDPDVGGLTLALGNTGDTLVLRDAGGASVDHLAWEGFEPGWDIVAGIGDALERFDPSIDSDGAADWQVTSPATPRGGGEVTLSCGDGLCSSGEDCYSCPSDCIGKTGGTPSKQFCCGNGTCEPVGEDVNNCPVDCT